MILASKSPRRIELLKLADFEFSIIPAISEENVPDGLEPHEVVMQLAEQKAGEIAQQHRNELIVGADTIVACENEILGKPRDTQDACRMLKLLSGKQHSVFTGVCLICGDKKKTFYEETKVCFYELTDEEIAAYIRSGEPMDKAGAYGIQEKGSMLVKEIHGDYFNVVGLPLSRLVREMKTFEQCS